MQNHEVTGRKNRYWVENPPGSRPTPPEMRRCTQKGVAAAPKVPARAGERCQRGGRKVPAGAERCRRWPKGASAAAERCQPGPKGAGGGRKVPAGAERCQRGPKGASGGPTAPKPASPGLKGASWAERCKRGGRKGAAPSRRRSGDLPGHRPTNRGKRRRPRKARGPLRTARLHPRAVHRRLQYYQQSLARPPPSPRRPSPRPATPRPVSP